MSLCKQVVPERASGTWLFPFAASGCKESSWNTEQSTTPTPLCQQMVPEGRGLLNCFLTKRTYAALCDPKTILLFVLLPYQQDCAAENPEI